MALSRENLRAYNEMIARINAMDDAALVALVEADACPFEPQHLIGVPLGMFHCEVCGDMVCAGFAHPRRKDMDPPPEA